MSFDIDWDSLKENVLEYLEEKGPSSFWCIYQRCEDLYTDSELRQALHILHDEEKVVSVDGFEVWALGLKGVRGVR